MKKIIAATLAVALTMPVAACSSEPSLSEDSTPQEIHAYITENGATIRQNDTRRYMRNICKMLSLEGGLDAAADVKEIHDGTMSVEQAQRNVGAAVLTTCPEREHKLEDDGEWW